MSVATFAQIHKARTDRQNADRGFVVSVPIIKASGDDQRLVWGWASIATLGGEPVVDVQGDVVPVAELEKAAHQYVKESRIGKRQHTGDPVLSLVESMVFTKARQAALGIDLGCEGWFAGWRVNDDDTWAAVKSGDLPALSIGGSAVRVPLGETQ